MLKQMRSELSKFGGMAFSTPVLLQLDFVDSC